MQEEYVDATDALQYVVFLYF